MTDYTTYILSLNRSEFSRVRRAIRLLTSLGVSDFNAQYTVIEAHRKQREARVTPTWAKHGLARIREANVAAGIE